MQGGLAEVQNMAWGSLATSVAIMSEVALFIIQIHFTISGDRVLVLRSKPLFHFGKSGNCLSCFFQDSYTKL